MANEMGPFSLERVEKAVEKVRQRLLRAAAALEAAGVPYAVAGGNAVALWVSRVDEAAVRNTQDVDILIRRSDFPAARAALESAGFVYRDTAGLDMFLDGPDGSARQAVRLLFAGGKVRPDDLAADPDVAESEAAEKFRVLNLEALVRKELTVFGREQGMHLRDMIDVGLIDGGWLTRLPRALANRLKTLLDNPEG